MNWAVLAGGCAVFFALHGAWSARISRRGGPAFAGWALFTFALPFLLVYLSFSGFPAIAPHFWPVWGLNILLNLGALYLFLSALRDGELGITYPLLALTPLFVVPVEWALVGAVPTALAFVGIVLIVLGIYLLNFRGIRGGFTAPIRALAEDRAAMRMLAVAIIWSVAGTLDRVAVLASSPAFYSAMFATGLSALFLLVLAVRARDRSGTLPEVRPAFRVWELVIHGLLFACMMVLQMEAIRGAQASYVIGIKRSGSVLAVLLGHVAFRERSLLPRLAGALIAVCGAITLVLSTS